MFIKMFQWHMQLYINPSHLKKKKINTWYLSYKNNSMILQNYTVEMNFKISQELFNIDVKHSSNLFHIK